MVVHGELIARVEVARAAPNDVVGTASEKAKIVNERNAYGEAVRDAFSGRKLPGDSGFAALVVRHRPQRDEDNTWATWMGALCGVRGDSELHWTAGAPLSGWAPQSVASVADDTLVAPVVYELWR